MRVLRAASAVAVLALLGLLVWDVAHHHGAGVAQKVDKGRAVPAPKLNLPRLDAAERLSLASLRGKVVVVNFWESYCVPCKGEARRLAAAARR
jgi:thiol-disulfide isomerase/thioredoxin